MGFAHLVHVYVNKNMAQAIKRFFSDCDETMQMRFRYWLTKLNSLIIFSMFNKTFIFKNGNLCLKHSSMNSDQSLNCQNGNLAFLSLFFPERVWRIINTPTEMPGFIFQRQKGSAFFMSYIVLGGNVPSKN